MFGWSEPSGREVVEWCGGAGEILVTKHIDRLISGFEKEREDLMKLWLKLERMVI